MSGGAWTDVWLVIGAFALTVPLVWLARRIGVSYPIVLVLAGLILGFVPGLPNVSLNPDLVLILFLPPLLYWEAITAPTDVMRRNAGWIGSLAVGLVIATTLAVAAAAHRVIPGLGWPMAFVLGALAAPTDELAAAPVLERLRMPRHLVAVVEGESLLNDASSLILYTAAVGAAVTGVFVPGRIALSFAIAAIGGIAIGVACGWLAVQTWRRIRDVELQPLIAVILPFLSYALAARLGGSGVLAVVSAGIYANRWTPFVFSPEARLRGAGFYESSVFLANALLFILVGLQLHALGHAIAREYAWTTIAFFALAVNAAVIVTRFAWFLLFEYLPGFGNSGSFGEPSPRRALVASWSGLRGAVSLAAALAIPVVTASGLPLPSRNLVIFLTFTVIVVTLVGGGLTLPLVARALHVTAGDEEEVELRSALRAMAKAADRRLNELVAAGKLLPAEAAVIRQHLASKRRLPGTPVNASERRSLTAERDVLAAERAALFALRTDDRLDNAVLRRIVRTLDIIEESIPDVAPETPSVQ